MEVAALLQTSKVRRAGLICGKSRGSRKQNRHLHDNITYHDAPVVQKFVGTERTMQHAWVLLAELAALYADGGWAGRITVCLAS